MDPQRDRPWLWGRERRCLPLPLPRHPLLAETFPRLPVNPPAVLAAALARLRYTSVRSLSLRVLSGVTGGNILTGNGDGFSVRTAKQQPLAPARLAAAALPRPSRAAAGVSEVYFTFFCAPGTS